MSYLTGFVLQLIFENTAELIDPEQLVILIWMMEAVFTLTASKPNK